MIKGSSRPPGLEDSLWPRETCLRGSVPKGFYLARLISADMRDLILPINLRESYQVSGQIYRIRQVSSVERKKKSQFRPEQTLPG